MIFIVWKTKETYKEKWSPFYVQFKFNQRKELF